MDIRPATSSEEGDLFEIHRAAFRSHIEQIWGWDEIWQRCNFATEFASSSTSTILIGAGVVGYVQFRDEDNRIYLQNIALLPAFQRKGIGARVVRELQEKAFALGVPLELGVFRTNASALRFYERLGFKRTGNTETHIEMSWRAI